MHNVREDGVIWLHKRRGSMRKCEICSLEHELGGSRSACVNALLAENQRLREQCGEEEKPWNGEHALMMDRLAQASMDMHRSRQSGEPTSASPAPLPPSMPESK